MTQTFAVCTHTQTHADSHKHTQSQRLFTCCVCFIAFLQYFGSFFSPFFWCCSLNDVAVLLPQKHTLCTLLSAPSLGPSPRRCLPSPTGVMIHFLSASRCTAGASLCCCCGAFCLCALVSGMGTECTFCLCVCACTLTCTRLSASF